MIYTLTGFMGCGKSSIGREVAKLAADFIDLDDAIVEREGRSIPEIFAAGGEAGFRKIERETLAVLLEEAGTGRHLLLSLGGGTLTDEGSRALVRGHCRCIYLRASIDTLVENLSEGGETDSRPMLAGAMSGAADAEARKQALRERIAAMMAVRGPIYEAASDHIIDIDGRSYDDIAREIMDYFSIPCQGKSQE